MKNLNTIIFNPDLTVSSQTEKPIQAFSSYQNIIRVVVPFGTEYVPFGIFHATNATDDVAVPSQFILMLPAGTVDVGGENYFVYEQKVPEAIVASLRATKIEFVLSLWAKADDFIGVQRYDETAAGYNTTTYIAAQLLLDFPDADTGEYVRVFNTETDWQFNGTAWVNTGDVFETVLEDSRSEIVEFALYRGKATGKPTHKPNNTEALIDAINLKVSKTGDTMTGQLQFANAALTRLIMGNNNITTDAGINATTFANGNNSSDAVKFSNFAQLFDVQVATPVGGETWIDTVALALAEKFGGILTVGELGEFFVRRDGGTNMTGNLNMGGNQITNVGNVDGVDISAFKQAYDTHTHTISQVDNLQSALDTLTGNVAALGGAFIFRGVIANTTAQVEANTALLTARIDVLLQRTPQTGDVLKDSDGGEWYYDGAAWRFMGQASIDLTQYYTKSEADSEFAALTHTHTESQITDLDKYTQAQVNTLLDGKAAAVHTHVESDITDLDKYTQSQTDALLANKVDVGVLSSNIILYPTVTASDVTGYVRAVSSISDPDYPSTAVNVTTPSVTGIKVPVGTVIADANLFVGNPGVINVPIVGNVRSSANNVEAEFYFEIYKRDSSGTEVLLGESDKTLPVVSQTYSEFSANALLNNGEFAATDRLVFKFFADKVGSVDGTFDFQYGGATPVRVLLNVPVAVTFQAEKIAYDNTTSQLTATNIQAAIDEVVVDIAANTSALATKPTIDPITGKIPASVIPLQFEDVLQGFFDDGVFYEEVGLTTPITGEEGKLYIDITTNTLYRFDGVAYVVIIDAAEINSINDIPDVVITGIANDQALVYNSTSGKWENQAIPRSIADQSDTTITSATNGQVLTWNGTAWVNAAIPTQALDDLTDVVITTPQANQLLVNNGTAFVNQAGSSSLVGLNNVQNYGIASQAEAEAGTSDEKYMTPLKTAQAIAELTPAETGLANVVYLTTTIATGNWSGTDPVTAVKTVSGVLSTDKPLIDIDLSSVSFANVEAKQTEYAKIYRVAATGANEITFYALEAPTEELVIQIKVVR
jgi:hypothetical protein